MIFFIILYTQAVNAIQRHMLRPLASSIQKLSIVELSREWQGKDLSGLLQIDAGKIPNANQMLSNLFSTNHSLCSLIHIDVHDTDISLETLKQLRMIQVPYFIRDMPKYSNRFGCCVAPVTVNIAGTLLSRSSTLRHAVIEQPAGSSYPIFYNNIGFPDEYATLQVLVQTNET
jgi:hypothetical protein